MLQKITCNMSYQHDVFLSRTCHFHHQKDRHAERSFVCNVHIDVYSHVSFSLSFGDHITQDGKGFSPKPLRTILSDTVLNISQSNITTLSGAACCTGSSISLYVIYCFDVIVP